MKYRILILPFVVVSILFLYSGKSPEPLITAANNQAPTDLPLYLKSIESEMDRLVELQHYDSLYTLAPKFQLQLSLVPDSIKTMYRRLCMLYAFQLTDQLGDYGAALQYYLRAHEQVMDPICLDKLSWYIENVISSIYTRFGDYEKSEYYALQVETSLKCNKQFDLLSRFYTNKGINSKSQGNIQKAIDYFNRGFYLADSLDYDLGIFSNSLSLGEIYIDTDEDSLALHYLNIAGKKLPALRNHQWYFDKKSGLETAFGYLNEQHKNFNKSCFYYLAAIQSLEHQYETKKHREFAKLYAALASVYLQSGKEDSAQYCIQQGILSLIPDFSGKIESLDSTFLYKENSFIDLLDVQYDLFSEKSGRHPDSTALKNAFSSVRLGLYANEKLRKDLTLDPSKLQAIRNNKHLTNSGIETLYQLYSIHPSSAYLKDVRQQFTRSKSILYNEKIRMQALALQMTREERTSMDSIEKAMLGLQDKKYEDHPDYDLINKELFQLQEKLNTITSRHTDIKKPKIHQADYLEYVQTDSSIFLFAEIRGHVHFLRLGSRNEFDSLLHRFNQFIALKELSPDSLICRNLYHFLIAPLPMGIPEKLVIIPDGQVSLIPFEILQDDKGEFLLSQSTISYEYQYEPYLLSEAVNEKPDSIFCLAPHYHQPSPLALVATRDGLYNLPFAKTEADTVQKIIGRNAFVSEDSSKAKCLENLKRSRIFHFSGHAIIKPDVAYLALSDGNEMKQKLTDQEISLMSNPMDMVVLSACETGLGKWEYGEGIRSLGRSFMEAGAGAAIYSLWSVNDHSTSRIMSSFYTYLKKGYNKDEALRKAKLNFLTHAHGGYTHPFHWAAFIATGDMHPLEKKTPEWLLILIVIMALSIIIGIIYKRKAKYSP